MADLEYRTGLVGMVASSSGVSVDAAYISDQGRLAHERLRQSHMLGLDCVAFENLATVAEACRDPDWDGDGALAVEQGTLLLGWLFLEALPTGTVAPTVGAEPDGSLTFEWHNNARKTFSVSVTPSGELPYAALIGESRVYDTTVFSGEVPAAILALVERVTRQ